MDIEKLDINAVCFGILCNFTPVCGEEKAKEAVALIRSLQTENEKLQAEVERQRRSADNGQHLYENAEQAYMKVLAELERVTAEKDAAIKELDEVTSEVDDLADFVDREIHPVVVSDFESLPAADISEARHGRWLTTNAYPHHLYCSVCYKTYAKNAKWVNELDLPTNYCPNCGAPMTYEAVDMVMERLEAMQDEAETV